MDPARLDAVPLLAGLPFGDRVAIADLARETNVDAGTALVRDGRFAFELIAIEDGEAELLRDDELVAWLRAGDVIGEIGALERVLGTTAIVARTPMALITLSAWDLRRLRRADPAAVARVQGLLLRERANARRCGSPR